MDDFMRAEFDAMRAAHDLMEPLDAAQRTRAVRWLAASLGVDLRDSDLVSDREALESVTRRLGGPDV